MINSRGAEQAAAPEIPADVARLLVEEAERINSPAFIAADPVQFPRSFSALQDIEIASLLSAIIAWGNRKMICRDAERLFDMMDRQPYAFVMEEAYERLDPERNVHRTLFCGHLAHFLRGLRAIYKRYPSLDAYAAAKRVGESSQYPAYELAALLVHEAEEANGGVSCSRCLPTNLRTTALKRLNMALRWLVRDDGIVDLGVWKSIPKSRLLIPMDVHVGNTARSLGLLLRKANDRRSTEALTALLSTLRPDDPAIFDYALFGIGVESRLADLQPLTD